MLTLWIIFFYGSFSNAITVQKAKVYVTVNSFHYKLETFHVLDEPNVIDYNCSSEILIVYMKRDNNIDTLTQGFLSKYSFKPEPSKNEWCQRTKTINDTYILVQFGKTINLVQDEALDNLIQNLLWKNDKIFYLLSELGIYSEIDGKFDKSKIIMELLVMPYLIYVLRIGYEILLDLYYIKYFLKEARYRNIKNPIESKKIDQKRIETINNSGGGDRCPRCEVVFVKLSQHLPHCKKKFSVN